jgi:uncharacterized small protein (DUF1192 family)
MNNPIKSDDPNAVEKISEKIALLERRQARCKAINAAHKKFLKDPASLDTAELSDNDKLIVRNYVPAYSWEPHPIAPYSLTSLSAEIRRLKARVPAVQHQQAMKECGAYDIGDVTYVEDDGRVQLSFPGKPSDVIRSDLKSHGFKWSPTRTAWVRALTESARYHGKRIAERAKES